MDRTTQSILLVFFTPFVCWDFATTYLGAIQIINVSKFFPLILTIFINGILGFTFIQKQKDEFIIYFTNIMWIAALLGDLTSSFYGNMKFSNIINPSIVQMFLIGLTALFTTGSTIALSYIIFREDYFKMKDIK